MRISDWSSDVCSSDLARARKQVARAAQHVGGDRHRAVRVELAHHRGDRGAVAPRKVEQQPLEIAADLNVHARRRGRRSEEHTSELQSLMRNSYAVYHLKKKKPEEEDIGIVEQRYDNVQAENLYREK